MTTARISNRDRQRRIAGLGKKGMMQAPGVIGIDVGTGGVRLSAVDMKGKLEWTSNISLEDGGRSVDGIHEQDPGIWWRAICELGQRLNRETGQDSEGRTVAAVSITSTSGSLVPVDKSGNPVRQALLYDDQRATAAAEQLNKAESAGSTQWTSSHSLSKAIWVREAEPEVWEKVARLLHPTDWLIAKLTGDFGVADHSNALKLGYDVETERWSTTLDHFGVPHSLLPRVVKSGTVIGRVCSTARAETGFSDAAVVAGTTDGLGGLIASGASAHADANTTLGTTLVWKVLAEKKPIAVSSAIYSHRHPAGFWAPGAASNTGPGSMRPADGLSPSEELDKAAFERLPSEIYCYPLSGRGERFPFLSSSARQFVTGTCRDEMDWYAAQLQAVAFIERWGYEAMEQSGVPIGRIVFSTGRAATSKGFSRVRAAVMKRTVLRSAHSNAAFGAAILAASAVHYGGNLADAIHEMTEIVARHVPDLSLAEKFDEAYHKFRNECSRRGYC
jgi:sugar (pentulose or hexulose) kinase